MCEKIKLTEILESIEFDYTINDNNLLSLKDQLQANWGNIESEEYSIDEDLASALIDRLEKYIYDYHVNGYVNTLEEELNEEVSSSDYPEILEKMKKYPNVFESCIDYMEAFVNPELFDISDILENLEIKAKCPRCGSRLYKSSNKDYAYFCQNCVEDLYSFECMGEVICTNDLMSQKKKKN